MGFFVAATIATARTSPTEAVERQHRIAVKDNYSSEIIIINSSSLLGTKPPDPKIPARVRFYVTAYSSSPDETDDTPFITASGKRVKRGVAASNMLPFGTKVKIPEIFGEEVFVIEDRMHKRFDDRVDIWMPTKKEALVFGKKLANVEVLLD